ncbi:MAG: flippase [Treponema sp.]|nr:flippase [Treponema sp.]
MQQKSLKKNIILNIFRTLMGIVFPFITFPYVSRVLGPENIGKVNYSASVVQYFSIIAALGINTYGMREAAKVREDKAKLNQLVKEVFIINIIATFVAYLLFFSAIIFISKLEVYRYLLIILGSGILFTTLGMEWLYNALEEYEYITVRSIVFQIISIILLFTFVRDRNDYMQYAVIIVISSVGSNLLNFFHLRKKISFSYCRKIELRRHIKPIVILFGGAVAVSLYTILDTTMLGFISGDEETGFYTVAIKLNRIVISLITSIGFVLRPRLSNYVETNKDAFDSLVYDTSNLYQMLCIPSVCGLFILSKPIILLICGTEYANSVLVMKIMSPVVFFICFGQFFTDQIFIPTRQDKCSLYPVLIAAVLNIFMNILLIPRFGAIGAAIATLIAEFIVCVIKFILCVCNEKASIRLFSNFWQYLIASLLMSIGLIFVDNILFINPFCKLGLNVVFGICIYTISLFVFRNEYAFRIVTVLKKKIGGDCHGK